MLGVRRHLHRRLGSATHEPLGDQYEAHHPELSLLVNFVSFISN